MIRNSLGSLKSILKFRSILAMLLLSILLFSGCTNQRYYKKNWHRTPTSTSRNRCGCNMIPANVPAPYIYTAKPYANKA